MIYDCLIIGGGIAGLQSSIQLGRYNHNVLVIDSNDGRSNLCKGYNNILGWPDGISGPKLREIGKKQAENFGVHFVDDKIEKAESIDGNFVLTGKDGKKYAGKRLLITTGVKDRIPNFPSLYPCLGISVFVCPDCDGYEVKNKRTIVMGSGNPGANMALALNYWTKEIIYINHEQAEVDEEILEKLKAKNIVYMNDPMKEVMANGENFQGVKLASGKSVMSSRAFLAFGGNEVRSDLARQLGVEVLENNHILVNPRTKMTNIQNVWAAGDVGAHSELVTIAMGEGSQAAIWIHKSLLETI
ncbi:NAD(P)/FAD-dependent oxidoreductase [Bacillus methanolicus]|uniref:FAD-dependent pyridine nucleotide-disulfide oxidoreductase n=1 Tax=Bacillus methanolicus (strain MGA3 / ATCC 53907) TaxID=796606 RepID=I3EBS8_BACMM|nr:NAD(P)/FAD-dependent oxidoreductase [Bacillus methanolicus]AIE61630.1 FAD-dependent pyridine nucleotide-disulfide oxidoreductase [Bacillus methanolicus MGA3]EIJ83949.1 reductase [Bacillus methanolicus MGA3]